MRDIKYLTITSRHDDITLCLTITDDNLNICGSYRVKHIEDMIHVLERARSVVSRDHIIHKRSLYSMISEWRVYNLLYSLECFRSRTQSVDLNDISTGIKIVYSILSILYPHI